jgi:protein-S-isoprenylcysteine O-methyltransferase Ste14
MLVIPALDHRFRWSQVPIYALVAGDLLVAIRFLIVFLVYKENTFASATIEVASEQRVISSGPYALMRHPMYMGGLLLFIGMSLALGSWSGLFVLLLIMPAPIWRILDEERLLAKNLPGYSEYLHRVNYRLVPFVR